MPQLPRRPTYAASVWPVSPCTPSQNFPCLCLSNSRQCVSRQQDQGRGLRQKRGDAKGGKIRPPDRTESSFPAPALCLPTRSLCCIGRSRSQHISSPRCHPQRKQCPVCSCSILRWPARRIGSHASRFSDHQAYPNRGSATP